MIINIIMIIIMNLILIRIMKIKTLIKNISMSILISIIKNGMRNIINKENNIINKENNIINKEI